MSAHTHYCQFCKQEWSHQCGNLCTWPTVCACGNCEFEAPETVLANSSVDLPPADVIAQIRAHRAPIRDFADYMTANWPPDVAEECEAEAVGTDCMELKLPEDMYCPTCATYARICREWYALPEVQQRMTA